MTVDVDTSPEVTCLAKALERTEARVGATA
ncbi:MAG: hypothetical protein JWN32_2884 [Solirubrobacterales bacterium]|nr:hypothetical protein [Solirubrobacterales bacterium]